MRLIALLSLVFLMHLFEVLPGHVPLHQMELAAVNADVPSFFAQVALYAEHRIVFTAFRQVDGALNTRVEIQLAMVFPSCGHEIRSGEGQNLCVVY
jgi:hypothetical protein